MGDNEIEVIPDTTWSGYENGKEPSFSNLYFIAKKLDVSVDWLLGLSDIKEPQIYEENNYKGRAGGIIRLIAAIIEGKENMFCLPYLPHYIHLDISSHLADKNVSKLLRKFQEDYQSLYSAIENAEENNLEMLNTDKKKRQCKDKYIGKLADILEKNAKEKSEG
jgi:transcriptional regulator with XRE-family HTH domain